MCLEKTLQSLHVDNFLLKSLVLPKIWSFTESSHLDLWDKEINEIGPVCILNVTTPSKNPELKELYINLPDEIAQQISDVIEIGTSNLYGGTGKDFPYTLKPLERVINRCKRLNVPLPDVFPISKAPFTEEHGWGKEQVKEYYYSN